MNMFLRPLSIGVLALLALVNCLRAQTTPAPATATTPAPAAPAAAEPAAPAVSVVVTPAFVNQYMFRGARLGGPSFEPTEEIDSGNLALGIGAAVVVGIVAYLAWTYRHDITATVNKWTGHVTA